MYPLAVVGSSSSRSLQTGPLISPSKAVCAKTSCSFHGARCSLPVDLVDAVLEGPGLFLALPLPLPLPLLGTMPLDLFCVDVDIVAANDDDVDDADANVAVLEAAVWPSLVFRFLPACVHSSSSHFSAEAVLLGLVAHHPPNTSRIDVNRRESGMSALERNFFFRRSVALT